MQGDYLIAGQQRASGDSFTAIHAQTGAVLEGDFAITPPADIADACTAAAQAFDTFRETTPQQRASFLESIASALEARAAAIVARAMLETGLPEARLNGELARTTGQLRQFGAIVSEGEWASAVIEPAQPARMPIPRPDLRTRQIAIGPVAVFGASNFPLAFSVAGGDTASALAAGCPVVVKAHPAHPGTSRLAAAAIADAVAKCGLPGGVFSLIQGPGNDIGSALVRHPAIKAVGFTGSRAGGLALMSVAAARMEPIPVYAEMSSVNPVLLFPAALAARAEDLARAYIGSATLFAGQFCTNPGLVIALDGPDLDRFLAVASEAMAGVAPQVMLTSGIAAAYASGIAAISAADGVKVAAAGPDGDPRCGAARLLTVHAEKLLADLALAHEVFGPSSLVVRCKDMTQIAYLLEQLEGQLTATLHLDEGDMALAAPLIPLLERKAGRILANGWPTGVEVCRSMVHGGPFPATSDARSTSVGTMAIHRFLRPVCYQALPDALLPPALQAANPLNLPRKTFA